MRRVGRAFVGPVVLAAAALVAVLGTIAAREVSPSPPSQAAGASAAKTRIGVFSREKILVAYYRSAVHDTYLRELRSKRDAAQARGDAAEAKRCEDEGAGLQDLAHQQLAGKAELLHVIDALRPGFGDVAAAANVSMIVEKPLWVASDASIELVDVSDALAAKLPAAARR